MGKKTKEQFISEAKAIHGTKFDYSRTTYQGDAVKVSITCSRHGLFITTPRHHLIEKSAGCRQCYKESRFFSPEPQEFAKYYLRHSVADTAKKYKVWRKAIHRYAKKLNLPNKNSLWRDCEVAMLSERQNQIVKGSLLGDGWLSLTKATVNAQFGTKHSTKQKGWLMWKHEVLLPFARSIISNKSVGRNRLPNGQIINDGSKTYEKCEFVTMRHPVFTHLEKEWYKRDGCGNYAYKTVGGKKQRIKCVPPRLSLTPLMLAVWFIDDGHNSQRHKTCTLCSVAFSKEEVETLTKEIQKLGLTECSVRRDHGGHSIAILRKSYMKFIELVKQQLPDLPDDVKYKVDTSKCCTKKELAKWPC